MINHMITNINYSIKDDLIKKYEGLFPSWVTIVATLIALIILLLFITKLVWKPVKKMVADRKLYVQNNIDESNQQNKNASLDRKQANFELSQARIEAVKIISDAKLKAEIMKNKITLETNKKSLRMISDAKAEIKSQKEALAIETKEKIIELSLQLAKKILGREVDNKVNKKLIEDFIKEN